MANEQNLNPVRSKKEARDLGRAGGVASGQARRKKKEFRELFEKMLAEEDGIIDGKKVTRKDRVTAKAIQMLLSSETSDKDFIKAFEVVRDTIGERPVEKVMVAEVDQDIIDEVEAMVLEDD